MARGGDPARFALRGKRSPAILLSCLVIATGCGAAGRTSPAALVGQLMPAAGFPVKIRHRFEWGNAGDFTSQGLSLAPVTQPSSAITVIDRAGFEAAAGELLAPSAAGPRAYSEVAKFDSAAGARKVLDYLHAEDLRQPCSRACAIAARPMPVVGIPGAMGAHQGPFTGRATRSPGQRFERYLVEFAIGPYLYIGKVTGSPGEVPAPLFSAGIKSFYEYARRQSAGSAG